MKNREIASLLGFLPLLQAGGGVLSVWGPEDYLQIIGGLLFFALGFFGWGWGYVYLGHTRRAVAAFFAGSLVNLWVLIVLFEEAQHVSGAYKEYHDFAVVFYPAVFVVVALAGVVLVVDADRLALRHNRIVREKQP